MASSLGRKLEDDSETVHRAKVSSLPDWKTSSKSLPDWLKSSWGEADEMPAEIGICASSVTVSAALGDVVVVVDETAHAIERKEIIRIQ